MVKENEEINLPGGKLKITVDKSHFYIMFRQKGIQPLITHISSKGSTNKCRYWDIVKYQLMPLSCGTDTLTASYNFSCQKQLHTSHCLDYKSKLRIKYARAKDERLMKEINEQMENPKKTATIHKGMTVKMMAEVFGVSTEDILKLYRLRKGDEKRRNSILTTEFQSIGLIKKLGKQFGIDQFDVVKKAEEKNHDLPKQPEPEPRDLVSRPPVVTIMGHVDHGKTSLLDALRKSNIVDKEFGGITQHIGAFCVKLPTGQEITFLDTPGHAAFSAMRGRGADITDIIILVVAADDGVMPQTKESIKHAQRAGVPIIVALNKIDMPEADIDRTIQDILLNDVLLEGHGGDTQWVPISAKKRENLLELQEKIIVLAELMELKADPKGLVEGYVIEAKQDNARGKMATVLVNRGTMKKGKLLLAGTSYVKVKGMFNEHGKKIEKATPGIPVEVMGWDTVPNAGDMVMEVKSEKAAKIALDWRIKNEKSAKLEKDFEIISEKKMEEKQEYLEKRLFKLKVGPRTFAVVNRKNIETSITKDGTNLPIVIKGDVSGSVEAIINTLSTCPPDQCRLDILDFGVGNITKSDIDHAQMFEGIVYGFNVQISKDIQDYANDANVDIKLHNVIYKLFDDLIETMNDRLPKIENREIIGEAVVLQCFTIEEAKKQISVGGSKCTWGTLKKALYYEVERNGESVYEGKLYSLKHHKKEVDSISEGKECGLALSDTNFHFEVDDKIICFNRKIEKQKLEWEPTFS